VPSSIVVTPAKRHFSLTTRDQNLNLDDFAMFSPSRSLRKYCLRLHRRRVPSCLNNDSCAQTFAQLELGFAVAQHSLPKIVEQEANCGLKARECLFRWQVPCRLVLLCGNFSAMLRRRRYSATLHSDREGRSLEW